MKIGISACLTGKRVRYDGKAKRNAEIIRLLQDHEWIPLCPEVAGGLGVPRIPSERNGSRVINEAGEDVTEPYDSGSRKCLDLLRTSDAACVILKARSPACGKGMIYDGTFTRRLTEGNGTFAEMCIKEGIRVFTEEETDEIRAFLKNSNCRQREERHP